MKLRRFFLIAAAMLSFVAGANAQQLTVATVTRPPFSMVKNGVDDGFSIDLWKMVAKELGRDYRIVRSEKFSDMLDMVRNNQADLAIANISITAEREREMDFTQPIFESGLQILMHSDGAGQLSIFRSLLSWDLAIAVVLAIGLLFLAGMTMWWFERRAQPYFEGPAKKAAFPAFWWSLNVIVNGGFEERVPKTLMGRLLGVLLVFSSLFIVSVFVAKITAVLTVDAIQNSVNSVNDLYGKQVGTIEGSTAEAFLSSRDFQYQTFASLEPMFDALDIEQIQAIVFDAPILAYHAKNSNGTETLAGPVFLRENYGIVLPSGSALAEPINRSLLKLRENGAYDRLIRKWFGGTGQDR